MTSEMTAMTNPASRRLSRRRFIHVSAAAAGMALLPVSNRLFAATTRSAEHLRIWRGTALGADALLKIHHPDRAAADRLIEACLAEVRRLERIFSLYIEDSALCRLNGEGRLADPPLELVELLGQGAEASRLTAGAFDTTVQPLWDLYARHFSKADADPAGPSKADIDAALQRVDFRALHIDPAEIAFTHPGMAVTLNGIAQGYITDRIVALLRQSGIDRSLVDMGETRAIGARPDGGPWIVGLEDPQHPGEIAERIAIENLAVASSGGYGTLFDPAGRFNHIFDPATGATSWRYSSVSVVARTATTADAYSTAFSLMPLAATRRIVESLDIEAHFALPGGARAVQGRLTA